MYNLKIGTYLFSKWVVLLFFSFAQLVIFLALLKMKYQDDLGNFPETLGFLLFVSSCSIVFGLLLSVMTTTTEEVMSILPIALMPQIILSGILSKITSPFIEGLSYFTFGRWGTEGLARIQDMDRGDKDLMFMGDNHQIKDNLYGAGDDLLKLFDTLKGNLSILLALKIMMVVLIVAKLISADSKRS
jgi:ABC-type transport system involved in multi-copper enzyme maturation permease subunit